MDHAAYGNAPIGVAAADVDDDAGTGSSSQLRHSCDVAFARRGKRARLAAAGGACWRAANRVPLLSAALTASSGALALLACRELTPTYEPTWTLRALKRLPWRVQRLGARAWLQAMLRSDGFDVPSGAALRRAAHRPPPHPMSLVRTIPLLDASECKAAITEAEEHAAANGGWLTDRHVAYPTTDIPISKLPKLAAKWNATIFPAVAAAFHEALELPEGSEVTPLDVFVVKYDYQGQRELAVHRDNGLLTFSLLLSDPGDFEAGGTYFESTGRVYRPSRGVGVLHSALVRHAGYPIEGGTRYVLVGFCGLTSPKLPMGFQDWRFGDPPWFVSSRVVSDEQILRRVWPSGATATASDAQEIELVPGDWDGTDDSDDGDEDYPTLEELLERGEITADQYAELSGGFSEVIDEPAAAQNEAIGAAEGTGTAEGDDHAEGARGREKPWYRKQHEIAAQARRDGRLLEAQAAPDDAGLAFEMWRNGDDLVALAVDRRQRGEGDQDSADDEPLVLGSVVYRDGPLTRDMCELLAELLPEGGDAARRVGRWWSRPLRSLRRLRPYRMAGMVHVYVLPDARRARLGEALTRFSMAMLQKRGYTHALTLADDRGSGKLRAWYEQLGFVGARIFQDTAMVARTSQPHAQER